MASLRRKHLVLACCAAGAVCAAAPPPPVCRAGEGLRLTPGAPFQLDGSGSRSKNGDPALGYSWRQASGRARVSWSDRSSAKPVIRGIVPGAYVFQLTVKDSTGAASTCKAAGWAHPASRPAARSGGASTRAVGSAGSAERVPNFGHLSASVFNYSSGSIPPALKRQVLEWQARRFDLVIGGSEDPRPHNPGVVWSGYIDFAYVYADQAYLVRDILDRYGFSWENVWTHANVDYTVPAGVAWKDIEQFDAFEKRSNGGNYSTARNGAFLVKGSTYRDVTVAAFDPSPDGVEIEDRLLLGYAEPFAEINFVLATPGEEVEPAWEYWNGEEYRRIDPVDDGTAGLTRNGRVSFTPPADWARRVEQGSRPKYWVRITVSASARKPRAARIFGENWTKASGSNNARGWAAEDGGIVNRGLGPLEFNPQPPGNASARFRYQARATGIWAPNAMFGNPGTVEDGRPAWGLVLSDRYLDRSAEAGTDGVMFDDGGAGPPVSAKSLDVPQDKSWAELTQDLYRFVRGRLESLYPGFYVGANTTNLAFGRIGAWMATENQYYAWLPSPYYAPRSNPNEITFDKLWGPSNPDNARAYMMCMDTAFILPAQFYGGWHFWDRGNRGPMLCLAMYYIGANSNTAFNYNPNGFYYTETDEFHYYADAAAAAEEIRQDKSGSAKRIPLRGGELPEGTANFRISEGDRLEGDIVNGAVREGVLTTNSPIHHAYAEGAKVSWIRAGRQSIDPLPPLDRIWKWSPWFPAMGVDVGTPDPGGWKAGERDTNWRTGTSISPIENCAVPGVPRWDSKGCPSVWRRDYTRAIVLMRPYSHETGIESEVDNYSKPIELDGTYYPLAADGTTGPGVQSIRLRAAEAAILMKEPAAGPAR